MVVILKVAPERQEICQRINCGLLDEWAYPFIKNVHNCTV
jgi:hypothetical protein